MSLRNCKTGNLSQIQNIHRFYHIFTNRHDLTHVNLVKFYLLTAKNKKITPHIILCISSVIN